MIPLIKSSFFKEKETKKKLQAFINQAERLSFGEECEKFEKNFAKYQGRLDCVFFNSGSSANLALIQALLNMGRIKKNDLAGFSAITWATNTMPLIQLGLQTVPIDVDLETLNVSSARLEEVLKKYKLKLFFITNALGFCSDIDKIQKICKKNKVILLEDNCESLGTIYKKKKLGNYSLASTFSFYIGHHMSTIEGGAVATDDLELATMLRLVRAHGWDRNLSPVEQKKIRNNSKNTSDFYAKYTFYDLGFNLRPTEINGFLGNCQLQYIKEIVNKRNKNFLKLAENIYSQTDKYYPIQYQHIDFISNFTFPILCRTQNILRKLISKCDNVIEIRPIISGDITKQPFYKKYMKKFTGTYSLPNASLIHKQGLYFGNNPEMSEADLKKISEIIVDI